MGQIRRLTLILFVFIAIGGGALALGFYSYRVAERIAEKSEESVAASNRALGQKLLDRIERVIIDGDRNLFRLVSLDDPREFKELWRRIVRLSPAVNGVMVLDERGQVVHLVAQIAAAQERLRFRKFVQDAIVPDLRLGELPPEEHRHLHRSYGGKEYLFSYIRRHPTGAPDYFVLLQLNVPYFVEEVFKSEFESVASSAWISVVDETGRALFGRVIEKTGTFVFDEKFPTTLYKWRLQVAPKALAEISDQGRQRRFGDVALVASAVGIIIMGLAVIFFALRQEQRANALKSVFIANVSHELKTPLSIIRMFSELLALRGAKDAAALREYAEIITRESDRLSALIDNVLDFSRIEGGRAAYHFSECDLATVVHRVAALAAYRCEQAGVSLTVDSPDTVPPLMMDESAMTLLLLNLVENALKYGATAETPEVGLRLERRGDDLVLAVSDNGPGIAKDERRRIFERFYRSRSAQDSGVRGSGIGLSLAKHIAEAHGGKVTVSGELGKGAVFEVCIPLTEGA